MLDGPVSKGDQRSWPAAGICRAPYWIYEDPAIYLREQQRIFGGLAWSYVGLEVEVPRPGDFKRTFVGEQSVVLVRDAHGELGAVVNRCAHRGIEFCRSERGHAKRFVCPYHQWVYDLRGNLLGVPFRRGVHGRGGMPDDFAPAENSLQKLRVESHRGVVFASYDERTPPLAEYLGASMLHYFERLFDGRQLVILGNSRQLIPCNWKLVLENSKDPYHATLLHTFLVTFGLFRADQKSEVRLDPTGRHAALVSRRGDQSASEHTAEMMSFKSSYKLHDPRLLDPVKEFPDDTTVVMQTLFPNLILQQQSNTLAIRQIVPRGPSRTELIWTFFGYEGDDEAMTERRLRQANLMGPAGLVSLDDGEVLKAAQEGVRLAGERTALAEMGGRTWEDSDYMVTEAALRGFYRYYKNIMELPAGRAGEVAHEHR